MSIQSSSASQSAPSSIGNACKADEAWPEIWGNVDTVLLDMDGTLLDLHFDNMFWQHRIPAMYAEKNGLSSIQAALEKLTPDFIALEGRLEWYCLDYWSNALALDVTEIKRLMAAEQPSLVKLRPNVLGFLQALQAAGKQVCLTTNAHPKAVEIKFAQLQACGKEPFDLNQYFDDIISSHEFGEPKESPIFWQRLRQKYSFEPAKTLFIDDSLAVLKAAQAYGIKYCIAVTQPDSQKPAREINEFTAINAFDEVMPIT